MGKSKGKGGRKESKAMEEGEYNNVIEVEKSTPGFDMKGKIIGEKGSHMHHIQDESGAKVWVEQDGKGEPITIRIAAGSQESLDKAMTLCQDLVDAVQEEYQDEGGKGSKGKGKRR